MQKQLRLIAVLVGISIFGSALAVTVMPFITEDQFLVTATANGMMGHVTLVVYDQDGNIKKYLQGDNVITNLAENCLVEVLFGVSVAACADGATDLLTVTIGTSTTTTAGRILTSLEETAAAGVGAASITATSAGETTGSKAVVDVVRTFTTPGATVYKEASLSDANGNMYARQQFGTAATLGASDNITVTWTVDIGPNN